jgi:hypothetical protein
MVAALVLAVGALGIGIASGQTSGNTFTGCLKNGTLTKVNIGNAPTSPCVGGATQVSWNEEGQPGQDGVVSTFWGNAPKSADIDSVPPDPSNIQALVPTGPVPDGWVSVVGSSLQVTAFGNNSSDVTADCSLMDSGVGEVTWPNIGGSSLQTLIQQVALSPGQSVSVEIMGLFQVDNGYVNVQCTVDSDGFDGIRFRVSGILVTPVNEAVIGLS